MKRNQSFNTNNTGKRLLTALENLGYDTSIYYKQKILKEINQSRLLSDTEKEILRNRIR